VLSSETMADPFSAAGSAVGVVALGLEVCKGLVWYIGKVKGEKQELSHISERLDELADVLENLTNTLGHAGPTPGCTIKTSTVLASSGVIACSTALEAIRQKVQPFKTAKPAQGFRVSVRY
jgi:hypothetical protein